MTIPDALLLLNHGSLDPRLKSYEGWKGITSLDILRLDYFFPEPHELTPPFAEDAFLPVLTSLKKNKGVDVWHCQQKSQWAHKRPNPYAVNMNKKTLKRWKNGHNMPKQPKTTPSFSHINLVNAGLTLPETNCCSHLNRGHPKRKSHLQNHGFSRALAVSFRDSYFFQ